MCLDRTFFRGFVTFGLLSIKRNNSRLFFLNNSQNSENFNKPNKIEKILIFYHLSILVTGRGGFFGLTTPAQPTTLFGQRQPQQTQSTTGVTQNATITSASTNATPGTLKLTLNYFKFWQRIFKRI